MTLERKRNVIHRLALAARTATSGDIAAGVETSIHGAAAVCDALGALYLPDAGLLVVSDLHLEKSAAFARRGMMLPPYDTLATLTVLAAVIARYDPKIVLSLGDNFHDRVGSTHMPAAFREMVVGMARGREWIWVNGNHDPDGVVDLPGQSLDEIHYAGLTFRHEPKGGLQKGEISGHLHPSATVRRRDKAIRRPCFATDGDRLLMPAFGVMSGGLDLDHKAMHGLFDRDALVAHLLGRDRIYSVRYGRLSS